MSWKDSLEREISKKQSVLVVGLDPMPVYLPDFLEGGDLPEKIMQFNRLVIDAVADQCVAVKPQSAYYEVYGSRGIEVLEKTIAYAKSKGLLVILDAKRGDIGTTCEAYARAYLTHGPLAVDALTIHPYLGKDGLLPFILEARKNDKGVFVLVKTSNPSSGDLQDLKLASLDTVYEHVADMVKELDDGNCVGAVVGGTYPEEAAAIRKILPQSYFLVPGYGAQGARGQDLTAFYDQRGLGALISASRSIIYPFIGRSEGVVQCTSDAYSRRVKEAAKQANADINAFRMAACSAKNTQKR